MRKELFLIVFITFSLASACKAQSFFSYQRERTLLATLGLNTSTYYGDLKDNRDILDAKPSLSLGALYYINPRVGIRGEFSWVTLSAKDEQSNDEGKIQRNLSFQSGNYELNVSGVVNLIPNGRRFYQRPDINLYIFGGVGGLYFNPKAVLDGKKYPLQPLQTEGVSYSRFTLVLPYGIGGRFKVNPFINVSVEAGWRKTFTDYIDDVSTKFIDNSAITDPIRQQLADRRPEIGLPVLAPGAKRGDPARKDSYMLFTAKIEYYLRWKFGSSQRKLYNRKRKATYR